MIQLSPSLEALQKKQEADLAGIVEAQNIGTVVASMLNKVQEGSEVSL
jgi:hypothetical protein